MTQTWTLKYADSGEPAGSVSADDLDQAVAQLYAQGLAVAEVDGDTIAVTVQPPGWNQP